MLVLKSQLPMEVCTIARTFRNIVEAEESRSGIGCDVVHRSSLVVCPSSERFVAQGAGVKV